MTVDWGLLFIGHEPSVQRRSQSRHGMSRLLLVGQKVVGLRSLMVGGSRKKGDSEKTPKDSLKLAHK